MGTGSLEATDNASKAVQKTPNRVTLESLTARVKTVEYLHPEAAPHFTIAVVVMDNGFVILGKTSPADPVNFDAELGKKFAYEDAVRQAWQLEGYLLCEKLWNRGAGPAGSTSEAGPNPEPQPEAARA